MSVSATTALPPPQYSDPERLVPFLPSERADTAATAAAERGAGKHLTMFGAEDDEPSFWDLLDVINPLQHIPVVNKIYQELTGDRIGVGARMAGGALFGGPLGLIASVVNCALEEETGQDVGGHMLALFRDEPAATPNTAIAAAPKAEPAEQLALATAPMPASPPLPVNPVVDLQSLPATDAKALPLRGAIMFSSDGAVANAPAAAQPVSAPALKSAGKAMPLAAGQPGRFMPVPARNGMTREYAPAPITVPVSNSGIRSNVPITGRDPVSHATAGVMAAQKVPATPQANAGQPPRPVMPSAVMPSVAGDATGGTGDWFNAMNQALDKYDRAGSLASRPLPNTNTVQ